MGRGSRGRAVRTARELEGKERSPIKISMATSLIRRWRRRRMIKTTSEVPVPAAEQVALEVKELAARATTRTLKFRSSTKRSTLE